MIALSRQYTHGSVKAFTALSPCQPLGQSGNAKPPSSTTSGGISRTCSPKQPPTRCSSSAPSSHHLDCHHCLTLHPCHILSPPTHGLGLHSPDEEGPLSWALLQLWQTRPHHEGLLRTTHSECPECQCYNDSKTHSQGLAAPHGIH